MRIESEFRELTQDERELSAEELSAVSGGLTLFRSAFGNLTTGDLGRAAAWLWKRL